MIKWNNISVPLDNPREFGSMRENLLFDAVRIKVNAVNVVSLGPFYGPFVENVQKLRLKENSFLFEIWYLLIN